MSVAKKVISFKLSVDSIDKAIKELEEYKQWIERKTDEFRRRVAERLRDEAQDGFNRSIVDHLIVNPNNPDAPHTPIKAEVKVDTSDSGNVTVVFTTGKDAVWVEFGAGVYFNGSAGSSPHPHGAELGLTIGDYGYGMGRRRAWGYKDENGNIVLTRGTPATMPMMKAMTTVLNEIDSIAREVFG